MNVVRPSTLASAPLLAPLHRGSAKRCTLVVRSEKTSRSLPDVVAPMMAAAAALFSAEKASALTYEVSSSPPPIEIPSAADAVASAASGLGAASALDLSVLQDSPVALAAGLGVSLVAGLAFASQTGKGPKVKAASPIVVNGILNEDANTIFVDIRSTSAIKESGNPVLKGIQGKTKSIPFTKAVKGEETEVVVDGFGEKFAKLKGIAENSVVVLFDSNGKQSPKAAAEILQFLEFKTVLYVSGGEEGWKATDLEWQEPSKGLNLSLPALPGIPSIPSISSLPDLPKLGEGIDVSGSAKEVTETLKKNPQVFGAGLVLGAIAAGSFVIINEFETILEVVGLVGGFNIFAREFLFAKKRTQTMDKLKTLVTEDIAPQEAAKDLQKLASAVLSVESDMAKSDDAKSIPTKPVKVSEDMTKKDEKIEEVKKVDATTKAATLSD